MGIGTQLAGLKIRKAPGEQLGMHGQRPVSIAGHARGLAKRVIACLDVRANDAGDLVVTKGDQYDVRETVGGKEVLEFVTRVQYF